MANNSFTFFSRNYRSIAKKIGTRYLSGSRIKPSGYSHGYEINIRSYPSRLFIRQPFWTALAGYVPPQIHAFAAAGQQATSILGARESLVTPASKLNACLQHTRIHDQCYSFCLNLNYRHIII